MKQVRAQVRSQKLHNPIFFSVPISEFEHACADVVSLVRPDTIIADVCSVKVHPVRVMQKVFPESQPILGTHPLFGPDSIKQYGVAGRKVVMCPVRIDEQAYRALTDTFLAIGLHVIESTPDQHDRDMAHSHALIHFIGRGLAALPIHEQEIATVDHEAFLRVQRMVTNDTWQLFFDMQTYNPYARVQRLTLLAALHELEKKLAEHQEAQE
jgi:prephenate dehydrogenase